VIINRNSDIRNSDGLSNRESAIESENKLLQVVRKSVNSINAVGSSFIIAPEDSSDISIPN
jgi:hypothetical protein